VATGLVVDEHGDVDPGTVPMKQAKKIDLYSFDYDLWSSDRSTFVFKARDVRKYDGRFSQDFSLFLSTGSDGSGEYLSIYWDAAGNQCAGQSVVDGKFGTIKGIRCSPRAKKDKVTITVPSKKIPGKKADGVYLFPGSMVADTKKGGNGATDEIERFYVTN
jgi:hypothetical protein